MAPFYSEFSDLPVYKLRAFLDEYDQPFEPSQLYSPAAEAKYVDTGQRVSEFRAIVDAECFGLAEELVAAVNRNQTSNVCRHSSDQRPVLCAPWLSDLCTPFCAPQGIRFSLVRSDVTEISYQPGGFFKRHQDFLSVQGNVVEEHTMLVCVTAAEAAVRTRGGATIIHQLGKSHKLAGTTIPGHAVVFRKDLEHEGELLGAGEKRIVSLNLLAIRDRSPQDQVLHVTFSCLAEAHASAVDELRAAADGERSYALAAADVSSEPLKNCIEWANQQAAAAGEPRAPVLPYCERLFSFEAFGTVFRILTRRAHASPFESHPDPAAHSPDPNHWHPRRRARVGRRLGQPPRRARLLLPGAPNELEPSTRPDLLLSPTIAGPAALRRDPRGSRARRPAVRGEHRDGGRPRRRRCDGAQLLPRHHPRQAARRRHVCRARREAAGAVAAAERGGRCAGGGASGRGGRRRHPRPDQPTAQRGAKRRAPPLDIRKVRPARPCAPAVLAHATHLSSCQRRAVSEAAEPFDASVICCESEERTRVVAAVARKLGLSYVPFRIIFVEVPRKPDAFSAHALP